MVTDPAMAQASRYVVGVDVGGTFTDVFVLDEATGAAEIAKVPSTRGDPSVGFIEGIRSRIADVAAIRTVVRNRTPPSSSTPA